MKRINDETVKEINKPNSACMMWSSDTGTCTKGDASWWWSTDTCGSNGDATGCAWGSKDTTSV